MPRYLSIATAFICRPSVQDIGERPLTQVSPHPFGHSKPAVLRRQAPGRLLGAAEEAPGAGGTGTHLHPRPRQLHLQHRLPGGRTSGLAWANTYSPICLRLGSSRLQEGSDDAAGKDLIIITWKREPAAGGRCGLGRKRRRLRTRRLSPCPAYSHQPSLTCCRITRLRSIRALQRLVL
jgi:hypothetical protein